MFSFHRLEPNRVPWEVLDAMPDRVIFQTKEWLQFLAETQNGEWIVAEIRQGSSVKGYFSGVLIRKLGVRILGSSFPGWTTPYIGFNLFPEVQRDALIPALEQWAFRTLGCLHYEVSDFQFQLQGGENATSSYTSYYTDLTQSEKDLFAAMDSACRRCIRKAEKTGVVIEEVHEEPFTEEYYAQLQDVFAKQGKAPTYGLERVRALVKHLLPTGNLLLLRARSPEGVTIGTGIYPGMNHVAQFWGNASWRQYQHYRPNEALHWYAMRYWKARGVRVFDWGGGGTYKEKYGVQPLSVPWYCKSRFRVLSAMRNGLQEVYYRTRPVIGWIQGRGKGQSPDIPDKTDGGGEDS